LRLRGPFDAAHGGCECVLVAVDRAPRGDGALAPLICPTPAELRQVVATAAWLAALAPDALFVSLPFTSGSTWLSFILEHLHTLTAMPTHRFVGAPLDHAGSVCAPSTPLLQRIQRLNRQYPERHAMRSGAQQLAHTLARVALPRARTLVLGEWTQLHALRAVFDAALVAECPG